VRSINLNGVARPAADAGWPAHVVAKSHARQYPSADIPRSARFGRRASNVGQCNAATDRDVRTPQPTRPRSARRCLSLPKIISGRNGDAAQPGSEWVQWRQIVGWFDARAHPSVMPSVCAPDCNMPHRTPERAASAAHQSSASGPGIRGAEYRSGVPHDHFATAIKVKFVGRECR